MFSVAVSAISILTACASLHLGRGCEVCASQPTGLDKADGKTRFRPNHWFCTAGPVLVYDTGGLAEPLTKLMAMLEARVSSCLGAVLTTLGVLVLADI